MRKIAGNPIWIGNAGDLRNPAEIQAVVELADNEPFTPLPRELVRLRFPISDGGENPPWLMRLAMISVAELIRAGTRTLVCCSNGMSRSICITSAAIAIASGRSIDDVLTEICATGPADVSPGLLGQIKSAASNLQ